MADFNDAKWYVIHTYSGYENKVATDLETIVENRGFQDLIHDIKIPTEKVTEIKDDGTTKEVERKIFPGYVLVKMIVTDESWYVVRNVRGVTGFVGPGSKPVPLTEAEVESLGVEKRTVEINYKVGDNVKVIDSPLEGYTGVVDEIDIENNTVKITISLFGRETPAELELNQLALID